MVQVQGWTECCGDLSGEGEGFGRGQTRRKITSCKNSTPDSHLESSQRNTVFSAKPKRVTFSSFLIKGFLWFYRSYWHCNTIFKIHNKAFLYLSGRPLSWVDWEKMSEAFFARLVLKFAHFKLLHCLSRSPPLTGNVVATKLSKELPQCLKSNVFWSTFQPFPSKMNNFKKVFLESEFCKLGF